MTVDGTGDAPGFTLTQADPAEPAGLLLIQHLWDELGTLYGDTGPCRFRPEELTGAGHLFVIAARGQEAIGCGALVPLEPEVAEVKRMFIEPPARGQGVARGVLGWLERNAALLGYKAVRLETGKRQPEAIGLYQSAGYRRIPCFGKHAGDPLSVCFEKKLG